MSGPALVRRFAPVTVAVLILLALGLFRLDARSLWFDEVFSVRLSASGIGHILQAARTGQANMVAYHLLLHGWMKLAQSTEWVRLFSVTAAIATVPVVHALARDVGGRLAGFAAASLFATSAFVVQYAQETRSYAWTMLLVTIALWSLRSAMRRDGRATWLIFVGSAALAMYTHFFSGFVLAAGGVAVLVAPPSSRARRHGLVAYVAIGLACLPLAYVLATSHDAAFTWVPRTNPTTVIRAIATIAGSGATPGQETPWSWFLVAAVAGLAGLGARSLALDRGRRFELALFGLALLAPWFGSIVVSALKPMFIARYLAVSVPPLAVLAGLGVGWVGRQASLGSRAPVVALATLAGVAALSLVGVGTWYVYHPETNWRDASAYVLDHAHPGDRLIVYEEWNRPAMVYYDGLQAAGRPIPTGLSKGLGTVDAAAYAKALKADLADVMPSRASVWLVLVSGSRGNPGLGDARFAPLRAAYVAAPPVSFDGLQVLRLQPAGG